MYQALYRKYRPKDFSEVSGQTVIVTTLKNAIINNKVSHAYLFTGPRGTGKTSIAKIFAKTINCEHLEDNLPCNKCVSCTQINNRQSTDIIEIDAASNNGVDEIRELKSKIALVPSFSKYKVYIIDEVHMLTQGAFNALLKTLEEPPKHIIFILATTEPQKIPSTILSRCQRYDFKKLSNQEIYNKLRFICEKEKIDIEDNAILEISRLSDGGMRDAISILDQAVSYKSEKILIDDIHDINGTLTQYDLEEFINSLLKNNIELTLDLLDKYNNNGKNLTKLVEEIILYLRNCLLFCKVPNYLNKNNIDIKPYLNVKDNLNTSNIYELVLSFSDLVNKMKISSNPKILLEIEILKYNSKNISREINEQVKSLEKVEIIKSVDKKTTEKKILNEDLNLYNDKIAKLQEIRINNTLSKFDKKLIPIVSKKLEKIKKYIIDPIYGKASSLLLDGNIKATSETNIIFVYKNESDSMLFNDNIIVLEELLKKICDSKYKIISLSIEKWNIIKDEFNNKKRKFEYLEDNININDIYKLKQKVKPEDELSLLFKNIVEYTREEI